ncbi:AAA-like domain protein [Thermincola ferriacetica]|uniref:AAA-like domain protein n=1 Tax=Thermincola ferriacetica TaxID=281456 RepID=A0A0L6VZT0_9FIRM|nr:DUF87 domain-containing protein [Thermincola ferriacetica]KNZ68653.1 AAA-like domain protein [Thermincola ferriacetica]
MPIDNLFPREQIVGVFRGFTEGGMEFHADLVLPYRNDFQNIPMHGQFLLVQLESPEEAVLGRITSVSSEGKLSSGVGEDYNLRAIRDNRPIPEDLREQYLKYKINIRVLGSLRLVNGTIVFVPSHRRIPHVGSPVAFPSNEVLKEIAGHNETGAELGFFALGEYIYAGDNTQFRDSKKDWMQVKHPEISVKFPVENLVSRRSFIFARAGFGKSNLNKLLFSRLYRSTPTVEKRGGRKVPVGTIIFDRDGEYFWPDDKGRPGLCDVPELRDNIVVFTSRQAPSKFYGSFVAGGIRLDIRRFRPSDIISIALSQEKQDQQNVRKLKGLNQDNWERLVNLIYRQKNEADLSEIKKFLNLDNQQDAEALAARANMTTIVNALHDPSSQFVDMLFMALADGKLCIVDISQLRGEQALILSGIILRRIFDRNQEEFTSAEPKTIPTIAVIEEAQSVLVPGVSATEPYIAWVKEGRKYDLGALLITQQPGSIPSDILSQGDNWFIFHLLSAVDLQNVKKANAHFSDDILSALLNEPIVGQGVFWSSVSGKPYPISVRVMSFESEVTTIDKNYDKDEIETYANHLKKKFAKALQESMESSNRVTYEDSEDVEVVIDNQEIYKNAVINNLKIKTEFIEKVRKGIPWRAVVSEIENELPDIIDNKNNFAYNMVSRCLDEIFGKENFGWHTYRNDKNILYVKALENLGDVNGDN